MNHRASKLLVFIVLMVALTVPAVAAGWIAYQNRVLNFQINHPADWHSTASKDAVVFQSADPNAQFGVRTRKPVSLSAWVELRRQEELLPDGSSRLEKTSDTRLANRPAKRIVLFSFDRYTVEEAVIARGKLFVLEYDAQNPNDPQFAAHQAIYARMRASFTPW